MILNESRVRNQTGAADRGSAGASRSPVRAWGLTVLLTGLVVVNWADKAVFGIMAQPLAKELHLSAADIGFAGSAFFLAFTIGGFAAGALHKWKTLRWLLFLLCLVWGASMLPMVLFAGFGVIVVCRVALGFFEGPSMALAHTAVFSWHPRRARALPASFLASGASIAKIAIAPVMALIMAEWGWRAMLVSLLVLSMIWSVLWLVFWKEGPYGERPGEKSEQSDSGVDGAVELEPSADADGRAVAAGDHGVRVPWSRILLTRTFIGAAAGIVAYYALVTVVLTWLPSYFEVGLGYSRVEAGVMFGIPSLVGLACIYVTGWIGDRLMVRGASSRVIRGIVPGIALLIGGVVLVFLPYLSTPAVAVAVVSLGYGIGSVIFPLCNAAVSEICPPQQLSGVLGVFLGIMAAGGLVAPYLTGVIVDSAASKTEGYAASFQYFGIAAIVGAVLVLLLVDAGRDRVKVLGTVA